MPLTTEHSRDLERNANRDAYVQYSPLSATESLVWEKIIANTVIQFGIQAGSAAGDSRSYRAHVLVHGTRFPPVRVAADQPLSTDASWQAEAISLFPTTRPMTKDEVQAYSKFRLRAAKRV